MAREQRGADARPRGRWFKRSVAAAFLACVVVLALPQLISKTSLRNTVLQGLVDDSNVTISCGAASLGWFSPTTIDDFGLESSDGNVRFAVKQLRTQKSLLDLFLSNHDLGEIVFSSPEIEILVPVGEDQADDDPDEIDDWPTLSVVIENGSLLVREQGNDPAIDVQGVNISFRIEQQPTGAVLIVDPIKITEHATLTPEQCDQGLQLVLPGISEEVSVEGEYSLELTEIRIPLASLDSAIDSDATKIEGIVTLHQVTTGFKNDVTRRMALVAAELMELGEVPNRIRLAEDSQLAFRYEQERIYHDAIAFVFPGVSDDFSIRTTGSVGLDESIDLQGLIKIPLSALEDSPLARKLSESPIEVRITGTINEPKVGLPAKQTWISKLDDRLLAPDLSAEEKELADKIISLLGDLVDETTGPIPKLSEPLLERVRKDGV